jgi:hypothetical protein
MTNSSMHQPAFPLIWYLYLSNIPSYLQGHTLYILTSKLVNFYVFEFLFPFYHSYQ